MTGLSRLGAARVSGFFNLVPIVTAALAVLLLGESLSGWVLAGGVLAVSGVVFAEYAAKRATMASGAKRPDAVGPDPRGPQPRRVVPHSACSTSCSSASAS